MGESKSSWAVDFIITIFSYVKVCYKNCVPTNDLPPKPPDVNGSKKIPTEFSLAQNYPNPFNPTTTIKFSLPSDQFVTLTISNMLGQKVIDLVKEFKAVGEYEVQFNASKLPSSVNLYRLQIGKYSAIRKMLLTK